MAAAAPAVPGPAGNRLRREVGFTGLTMISLGSIIGSGWLLGALTAASTSTSKGNPPPGASSILSWLLGGIILAILALVHAELGSTYPVSGGTARFPFLSFGAIGGFTGGWMAWIQAVTIAPIEVEASIGYINSKYHLGLLHTSGVNAGTLTGDGILLGAGFMILFSFINIMGVKWLAESNNIAVYWKVLIPTITIIALLVVSFHGHNFNTGGGFLQGPDGGLKAIVGALPLGIVFALEGFEQATQIGGEARNPQRDIPRAIISAMIIGTIIYLLLEVAFIGALNPHDIAKSWTSPISGVGAFGPYATLATRAGLGWLAILLYIDAVVSPGGTGLVYLGTSSRLSYGLGRNGYFPHVIDWVNRRGIPLVSIVIAFVVGMLVFLPFPSWAGLVGFVTSATVLMYAMAPVSLASLRRTDGDRPRGYRLPAAGVLCPLAFILANLVVYWSGWGIVAWLYAIVVFGFIIFAIYQALIPRARRTIIDWRAGAWIPFWLAGLGIITWQGQFTATTPIFGVVLTNTGNIPFWYDILAVSGFSLIIYFVAVRFGLPTIRVRQAIETVEEEAAVEDAELSPAF